LDLILLPNAGQQAQVAVLGGMVTSRSGADIKNHNRFGEVRCHNCFERFRPAQGAKSAACPGCGWEWYISWSGRLAKIRKPVWESWEGQLAQAQEAEE